LLERRNKRKEEGDLYRKIDTGIKGERKEGRLGWVRVWA